MVIYIIFSAGGGGGRWWSTQMNHQTPTRTVFNPDVIRRMSRFKSALLNRESIAARSPLRSLADNGEK